MDIENTPEYSRQNLHGIEDVERALSRLQKDLPRANIDLLRNFNKTYLIITRNVMQASSDDSFDHPDFLEKFDALFAHYYIEALRNHLGKNTLALPPAWKYAFEAAEKGKASPFKCMVLGVNAHINNDIPQVLLEVGASRQHNRDYYFVNSIIKRSIDEVIDELEASDRLINPKMTVLRPVYKLLMHVLVLMFRRLAWCNFRLLQKGSIERHLVELRSKRVALLVRLLPM